MKNILICVCMIIGIAFATFAGAMSDKLDSWQFINNVKPKKTAKAYLVFFQSPIYLGMEYIAKIHKRHIKNDPSLELIFISCDRDEEETLWLAKRVGAQFPITIKAQNDKISDIPDLIKRSRESGDDLAIYSHDGELMSSGHSGILFDPDLFKFLKSDQCEETIDDIVWAYRAYKGEACIIGCQTAEKYRYPPIIDAATVTVPGTLGGAKVVTFWPHTLYALTQTTEITIPGTVRYLPPSLIVASDTLRTLNFPGRKKFPALLKGGPERGTFSPLCGRVGEAPKIVIHAPAKMVKKPKKFAGMEVIYDLE